MKVSKYSIYVLIPVMGAAVPMVAHADFVSDSTMNLGFRNYYFNNDYREGHTGPSKTAEWAQGFKLDYQSGFTEGPVGFGLDAQGLQGIKLDSGKGRHVGSTMIPSNGDTAADDWSRFGLTFKAKVSKTQAQIGTLIPKLPILIANDGRLLPQTFQGAMVTSKEIDNLTVIGGKIDRVTGRGSSDRTGMAIGGGQKESDAFYFGGLDYKIGNDLLVQYYQAELKDYYDQQFAGAVHTWHLTDAQTLKTDLRYFRTRSNGANSSGTTGYQVGGFTRDGDGEVHNDLWSATFIYSAYGHSVLLGYQRISDDSNFVQLNQASLGGGVEAGGSSTYLYTDRLVSNFTRAGQTTTYAQYSYDFAAIGVPGLNASVMYLDSDNIKTANSGRAKEDETNYIVSYVVQSGPFKRVGFSWYSAVLHSDVVSDQDQNRVTLSYSIPIF